MGYTITSLEGHEGGVKRGRAHGVAARELGGARERRSRQGKPAQRQAGGKT